MDTIQAIRVFARVAELNSFTKAAESLGLPKASVSHWIQTLESELGSRLLQRTTRRVQLTHDGQMFYERSQDLLSDMDELTSLFQDAPGTLAGRVRVDMPSRMARYRVIPRLPEFFAEHPRLNVEIGSTDREVELIEEGYDCVVRVGELGDSNLMAKRLGSLPVGNFVSPSYIKKYGRPRTLDDLSKHYLVHYAYTFGEKPEGFEHWDGTRYRSVPMRGLVVVNNAESYCAACEAGLGIIQSPRHTLEEALKKGRLVEVLPQLKPEPMPIALVYPSKRHLSKRVRVFMDWLEAVLKEELL